MDIKNLSVFFPAYNEEKNISQTITRAVDFLTRKKIDYEIIVVDDGSTDQTASVVKKLRTANQKIKLVQHKLNRGYGGALKTGIKNF